MVVNDMHHNIKIYLHLPVADSCEVELLFLPIPTPKRSRSRSRQLLSLFGERCSGFRFPVSVF